MLGCDTIFLDTITHVNVLKLIITTSLSSNSDSCFVPPLKVATAATYTFQTTHLASVLCFLSSFF